MSVPAWQRRIGWVGVVLLYMAACAWGVLEVHYSGDTWIGLAAGRQIMTEPVFPKADTFSYTFYGQVWFNQNWLSHVFFWLLYERLGRTALVIGTWAVSVGTFSFVLGATWFRSRSWLAAFLAASLVAIASRDWLSIRPATIQFFLLAAAWFSLSALLGQGERRRWWPVVLLMLIYGVWPHAHGSFLFGFGLLGLFGGCAALAGLIGLRFSTKAAVSLWQWMALAVVSVMATVLSALLSPYGLDNLTHPFKVVESEVFRQVGEWFPPYWPGQFPPVLRFWISLAIAAASPLFFLIVRGLDSAHVERPARDSGSFATRTRREASARAAEPSRMRHDGPASGSKSARLNVVLFDLASVGIGLYMAMFARRFAPVFYILATPALVSWIIRLARPLSARARRMGWFAATYGAWIGAIVAIVVTSYAAHRELVADIRALGSFDLLDRVTCNYRTPQSALEFMRRNGLTPNVMTEWKVAAAVMFEVPGARVFIDGRAQQVYTEDHFKAYMWLMGVLPSRADAASALLDRFKTDMVLLPVWKTADPLALALKSQGQWMIVHAEPGATIWVRRGSPVMDQLLERSRTGTLWRPGGAGT